MASVKLLNAVTKNTDGQWYTAGADEYIKITMPFDSSLNNGIVRIETRSTDANPIVSEAAITQESYFSSAVLFMKQDEQLRACFWTQDSDVAPITVEAIGSLT